MRATTVLIALAQQLEALKAREDFAGATAFPDSEALRALELITRERPAIVAVDKTFAGTARGAALINRIKADPALTACQIRIVTNDNGSQPADAAPTLRVMPPAPLDQRGTRRAPRTRIADGVEVLIDGHAATIVDMSVLGIQVVSPTIVKPNQRVRVVMQGTPIRVNAVVAWVSFEIPEGVPRYRAGIEFLDANQAANAAFIDAHRR